MENSTNTQVQMSAYSIHMSTIADIFCVLLIVFTALRIFRVFVAVFRCTLKTFIVHNSNHKLKSACVIIYCVLIEVIRVGLQYALVEK